MTPEQRKAELKAFDAWMKPIEPIPGHTEIAELVRIGTQAGWEKRAERAIDRCGKIQSLLDEGARDNETRKGSITAIKAAALEVTGEALTDVDAWMLDQEYYNNLTPSDSEPGRRDAMAIVRYFLSEAAR